MQQASPHLVEKGVRHRLRHRKPLRMIIPQQPVHEVPPALQHRRRPSGTGILCHTLWGYGGLRPRRRPKNYVAARPLDRSALYRSTGACGGSRPSPLPQYRSGCRPRGSVRPARRPHLQECSGGPPCVRGEDQALGTAAGHVCADRFSRRAQPLQFQCSSSVAFHLLALGGRDGGPSACRRC